jgi:hypothetical protein
MGRGLADTRREGKGGRQASHAHAEVNTRVAPRRLYSGKPQGQTLAQGEPMTTKLLLIAGVAACLVVASTTADAKHRKWHARHAHTTTYVQPGPFYKQEPARMIEIKPGLYISSYGCVTDEGYGRYLPCDAGRGSGR